jgi:hypothetical protein
MQNNTFSNCNTLKFFCQTKNIYKEDIEIMNGEEGIISIFDDEGITVKFTDKKIIKYKWQEKEEN